MSTTSPFIKMVLQILDENPDTWGDVLNVSALELLEDAIAGTAAVTLVAATDYTLDDTTGGPTAADGARYMILDVDGTPGAATNIIVPTRSKTYVAANNTTDASDIVIKTAAGTGQTIPNGETHWVYCDGTDVLAVGVLSANNATTADFATNSNQLGGVDSTEHALKGAAQTFTKGQVVDRVAVTLDVSDLDIDCSLSNSFYHLTTAAFNLTAPTNATNGQQFSLFIEQGVGAPHAITFQASTFMFAGGTAPSLSTTFGAIDYLAFEYVTGLSDLGGNRWVGSIIKDVSTV